MYNSLLYRPCATGTFVFETFVDGYPGSRSDGYAFPYVSQVFLPENADGYILTDDGYTVLADYPSNFSKLDTGLFYHKFTLPTGTGSLGTYVFDVTYYDSPEEVIKKISYQV